MITQVLELKGSWDRCLREDKTWRGQIEQWVQGKLNIHQCFWWNRKHGNRVMFS